MAFEIIRCPACDRETRIPETLLGEPVKCPLCKSYFEAPVRDEFGHLGEPKIMDVPVVEAASRSRSKTMPAPVITGFFVVAIGFLSLVIDLFTFIQTDKDPEAYRQYLQKTFDVFYGENNQVQVTEKQIDTIKMVNGLFGFLSTLIIIGGVGMMFQKWYNMCVISCVLLMINLPNGCCCLGLPVGIMGLVKLLDPDMRRSFSSRAIG